MKAKTSALDDIRKLRDLLGAECTGLLDLEDRTYLEEGVRMTAQKRAGTSNWLRERLWGLVGTVLLAVGSAFAGAAIDRFSDEIKAWVRTLFVGGIGGTYVLETWTYPENGPPELVPSVQTIDLKDTGRTVFGTIRSQMSGFEYELFGYHRIKYLAMSYGGRGPLGGGTLALQTEIANGLSPVFWGWRTSVECVGPDSYFVECPALMFKQGVQNPEEPYKDFFQVHQCWKVASDKPPELCKDLKARK